MELGVYSFGDNNQNPVTGETLTPAKSMANLLERIRLADAVGLDYFGIGEHHRPDFAVSSPLTVIAAAAAQTKTIRLGSAVTVLSTEDPVRVYQQFATADLISNGRVELCAGRGSFIESYPLFGADLGDYDALYEEKLALLLQIDAGNPVTWKGRFRPPLSKAEILPRPFGEHLDIWIGTGGTPESSHRAGILGKPVAYAVIGGQPLRFAPLAEIYRDAFKESGAPKEEQKVAISGFGFLAEDAKKAKEFFYPYWAHAMAKISKERGFPGPDPESYRFQANGDGAFFVGSAEEIAERIVTLHRHMRHDRQIFQMDLANIPQKECLKAIELLGTEVLPRVKKAI